MKNVFKLYIRSTVTTRIESTDAELKHKNKIGESDEQESCLEKILLF